MDLNAYIRLLRFHWVAILLVALAGAAVGAVVAQTQSPVYEARAQMLVTVAAPGEDSSQAYQGALLAQQRATSYTTLLTSQSVLRQLSEQLGLPYSVEHMKSHITATNPADTAVIDVTVKDRSAGQARQIAQALGPAFSKVVTSVENPGQAGGGRTPVISVRTLNPVQLMEHPVSPHKGFDVMLGLTTGLVLGLAWAVVREVTDTRIRDLHDLRHGTDVDVLGVLPHGRRRGDTDFRSGLPASTAEAQAYRWLALTTELSARSPGPRALVLTSAAREDGVTAVAVGLAIALAEGGTRTVLVDAQGRSARAADLLGLTSPWDLTDVVNARVPVDEALTAWRADMPLRVLARSGAEKGRDPAPLRQAEVGELCRRLMERADVVLLVAPPVLNRSDATVMSRAVGQAMLVAEARTTRLPDLDQSLQRLRSVGVTVLGAVLNGERGRRGVPYVPPVPPAPHADGHDVRHQNRGRSHTAAWSAGTNGVPRAETDRGRR